MNANSYRNAFFAVLIVCLLLVGGLGWTLLHRSSPGSAQNLSDPVVAEGPLAAGQLHASSAAAQNGAVPALAPVRISPQRLQ